MAEQEAIPKEQVLFYQELRFCITSSLRNSFSVSEQVPGARAWYAAPAKCEAIVGTVVTAASLHCWEKRVMRERMTCTKQHGYLGDRNGFTW